MTYKYTILTFSSYKNGKLQKSKACSQPLEEHFQVIYLQRKITVIFHSVTCLHISISQLKNILQLTQRQFLQSELYTHLSDQKFYQPVKLT